MREFVDSDERSFGIADGDALPGNTATVHWFFTIIVC
jgi:hypothetical protein